MKSNQRTIFILIIIGLIFSITILFFTGVWKKEKQTPTQSNPYELLEINYKAQSSDISVFGQINSDRNMEVRMNVSGKIDDNNHTLRPGTSFKKNDILIKVDRLAILYELLTTRTEFKQFLQEILQKLPTEIEDRKDTWTSFKDDIQRTKLLPALPTIHSDAEENYFTEVGLYTQFYKIKKLELKAEDYIYAAPFDGFITNSKVHPGSTIKKNQPIIQISKKNSLIVEAHVPIDLIHHYENSEQVYYVNADNDTLGKGKIHHVESKLSDSSTVAVQFSIDTQSYKDLGKVVRIVIPQNHINKGVVLPRSAVKDNHVVLFQSNKKIMTPIHTLTALEDSIAVKGLPNHCFVIVPYP